MPSPDGSSVHLLLLGNVMATFLLKSFSLLPKLFCRLLCVMMLFLYVTFCILGFRVVWLPCNFAFLNDMSCSILSKLIATTPSSMILMVEPSSMRCAEPQTVHSWYVLRWLLIPSRTLPQWRHIVDTCRSCSWNNFQINFHFTHCFIAMTCCVLKQFDSFFKFKPSFLTLVHLIADM